MTNNMITSSFSITEAIEILKPLVYFVIGMVIYSIFVFKFYRFLARKDIFKLNLAQYNTTSFGFLRKIFSILFYVIEYILLFPVFVFFWFGIISLLFAFLMKEPIIQNILLVSMALVAAVRVTAYYTEELSKDLAKMMPFALLGIFLVDAAYFSYSESLVIVKQIPSTWNILLYYLIFIILLEFILRITHGVLRPFLPKKREEL